MKLRMFTQQEARSNYTINEHHLTKRVQAIQGLNNQSTHTRLSLLHLLTTQLKTTAWSLRKRTNGEA
jgi:hypothetical protein